jgi:hypothetical protein
VYVALPLSHNIWHVWLFHYRLRKVYRRKRESNTFTILFLSTIRLFIITINAKYLVF